MGIQKIYYAFAVLFIFFFSFTPSVSGQDVGDEQTGLASWYGAKYHGRRTSSGEIYNRHKLTAAHNGLPLGTKVRATNLRTGKSVIVKINDRGPFKAPRVIDLSETAFKTIASRSVGLTDIKVEVLELPAEFLAKRAAERRLIEKDLEVTEDKELLAAATPAGPPASSPIRLEEKEAETAVLPAVPTLAISPKTYTLQAGAFGDQNNAEQQISKLKRIYQKMPIARLEETVKDKKIHRILAGRYQTKALAEEARKDLEKKGFKAMVLEVPEESLVASTR